MSEALVIISWAALTLAGQGLADEFTPRKVVPPFEPITNPGMWSAAEAGDEVRDNELVLGVHVEGEARAYPINMLTNPTREVINDTIAGRAIAATW